ncbi:CoA-binding protein [Clostridium sp. DJ247]|uniref:CoA-binding protein n=1 Tax=Clostridium sp. DJ247 TaxID=2726188 RepID=UPI00162AB675|nr:CoA-binding protein [Clostridium sp. DJ247]MBC2582199.1 CoA-binding protein [Clostridium sp. DJ247]
MEALKLLDYKNWVVVGDVLNHNKYAYRIINSLKNANFNAEGVNPRDTTGEVYKSLDKVPYKIDVIDLCINPIDGLKVIKSAIELNIDKVLIQPGAESDEILNLCKSNGIIAIEGCVLVELSKL